MDDDTFFGPSWIGKEIDFEQPQPSTWRILEKQREEAHLLTWHDLNGLLGGPKISYVCARFLCENPQGSARAFLRVYMQIPHAGTRLEPAEVRGSQAGRREHDEVTAYKRFGRKGARHMPKSLGYKLAFHPKDSMLVPGGYVEYILWEKLPGVHLDDHAFWDLSPEERDDVVDAFNHAYKELFELGIKPLFYGPSHLLWDKENRTIYFVDFRETSKINDKDGPGKEVLDKWNLLTPPSHVVDDPRPKERRPAPTLPHIGQFR